MKKIMIAAIAIALPASITAQSFVDAYNLSQNDLRGTARFMSMAGAFGALGGDLSTLNQNPAGIGVYRSSEIGLTLDFDFMSSNSYNGVTTSDTHVYCPNVGYIGAINLGGDVMPYFQWGISYGRLASFDRTVKGNISDLRYSMSDFIANQTNGIAPADLEYDENPPFSQSNPYNPYYNQNVPWLSVLGYNAYSIVPQGDTSNYNGSPFNYGESDYIIRQRGHMDEYAINFGGNIMNAVYWGLGFGITEINLSQEMNYGENLINDDTPANVGLDRLAYTDLYNSNRITGTGFNIKLGAIIKPINELRFGIAVHTPTWYNLQQTRYGEMGYEYYNFNETLPYLSSNPNNNTLPYTPTNNFDWKLRTPWKLMLSGAAVIGGRFIASLDYELDAYNNIQASDYNGTELRDIKDSAKSYFQPQHNVRLGVEYRVTPQFSVRGGFAESLSGVKNEAINGTIVESPNKYDTTNTNPSYSFTTNTRYITLGLGYRYHGFYVDAAYVNKYSHCDFYPYTGFEFDSNGKSITKTKYAIGENNLVLSIGYKF